MFLSQDQIQELTGYKVPKCQIKWLRENGIKYLVSATGFPKVLHSHIESLIGNSTKNLLRKSEPNEAALNKWMGL